MNSSISLSQSSAASPFKGEALYSISLFLSDNWFCIINSLVWLSKQALQTQQDGLDVVWRSREEIEHVVPQVVLPKQLSEEDGQKLFASLEAAGLEPYEDHIPGKRGQAPAAEDGFLIQLGSEEVRCAFSIPASVHLRPSILLQLLLLLALRH